MIWDCGISQISEAPPQTDEAIPRSRATGFGDDLRFVSAGKNVAEFIVAAVEADSL